MSSTLMTERTGMHLPGLGVPGLGTTPIQAPTALTLGTNWCVVPKCTYKIEKIANGLKLHCICEDKTSCSMVQNLCSMLAGGMYSCCCQLNGMTVCQLNLTMGMCKCENTEHGVCISCCSGDAQCCAMIQACCDCLSCLLEAGCCCTLCCNSTPVCCGCCDPKGGAKKK